MLTETLCAARLRATNVLTCNQQYANPQKG